MIIDNKVVQMEFNNKDFEKNVKTSMGTLDKLKNSLKFDDSQKSLSNLTKTLNKVDFSAMANSIENLNKRFSTLGIIGMRVIQNLTDKGMQMISNTFNKMTSTIITGGKNRAFNIENAHFQLQGLLKDEEKVQAVMDNAMEAVDGTAYGFDEAANAASQFAASGVQAGEQMLGALKGITGVAAMTNSSFSDIANIFTTVSGNGRLMGDQLNQLAARGMNAASTLTEYFNGVNNGSIQVSDNIKAAVQSVSKSTSLTEQQIREFVSKGKISFDIFADAMNSTFGEHAKKANETFNGALSNMKSALGRIGAEFISPLIEQNGPFVKMFNSLRIMFNNLKKQIVPFAKLFTDTAAKVIGKFTNTVNSIAKVIKDADLSGLMKAAKNIIEGVGASLRGLGNVLKPIFIAFKEILPPFQNFVDLTERFKSWSFDKYLTKSQADSLYENFHYIFGDVSLIIEDLMHNIKSVASAFKSAFKEMFPDDILDRVYQVINVISEASSNFFMSEKTIGNLKNAFKGLFAIFSIGVKIFKAFIEPATRAISFFIEKVIAVVGHIGKWIVALNEYFEKNDTFEQIVRGINILLYSLGDAIKSIYEKLNAFIKYLTGKSIGDIFKDIKDKIVNSIKAIGDFFSGTTIIDTLTKFADKIREAFGVTKDSVEGFGKINTSGAQKFADVLKKIFMPLGVAFDLVKIVAKGIWGAIKGAFPLFKKVFDEIMDFAKSIVDKLKSASSTDILNYVKSGALIMITTKFSGFLSKLTNAINSNAKTIGGLKGLINNVTGVVKKVQSVLDDVRGTIQMWQQSIKANILIKIAAAVAILTGALVVLSGIDHDKLQDALGIITMEFVELVAAMKILSSGTASTNSMMSIGTAMLEMALSVLILAAAMKKLAALDEDAINKAMGAVTLMITELVLSMKLLEKSDSAVKGLISLSVAVYVLSSAVKKLSKIDPDVLWDAIGAFSAIISMITASVKIMSDSKRMISIGNGLILMALAMSIFAGVVKKFAKIGLEELGVGLLGFFAVLAMVTTASILLSKNSKGMIKAASSMILFADAMVIMGAAFKIFSAGGDLKKTAIGLLAFGGVLTILTGFIKLLQTNTRGMLKIANTMVVLSLAMTIMGAAFKIFASNDIEQAGVGLLAFGGSLSIIATFFKVIQSDTSGLMKAVGALILFSGAMLIMASAVKKFSGMNMDDIGVALLGFAGSIGVLILLAKVLTEKDVARLDAISFSLYILSSGMRDIAEALKEFSSIGIPAIAYGLGGFAIALGILIAAIKILQMNTGGLLKIAIGLTVLSKALVLIAVAMKIFGSMGLLAIIGSLVMLAGTFVLISTAATLLSKTTPYILKLAKALVVLGVGVLGVGTGMFLLSLGLVSIAGAGAAAIASLLALVKGFIGLLPFLGEQVGEMIKVLLSKLTNLMPELGEFFKGLFEMLLTTLGSLLGSLVSMVMEFIDKMMAALAKHMPSIALSVIDLLINLMDVVGKNARRLTDKAVNLLLDLIEGLGEGLKKNTKKIVTVIGDFIINVLTSVLEMAFGWLLDWIGGSIDQVIAIETSFTEKQKDIIDRIDAMSQSYRDLMSARDSNLSDVNGEFAYIENLKDEYNSLIDSNGKIKTGYEKRAETVLTTLANATGMELDQIKSLIDENGKLSESFDEVIQKMKAEAYISANKDAYEAAIKNQADAKKLMVEANNEWTSAQAAYLEAYNARKEAADQVSKLYSEGNREAAEQLQHRIDTELTPLVTQYGDAAYNLKLKFQEMEDTYVGYSQEIMNTQNLMYAAEQGHLEDLDKYMDNLNYSLITSATGTQRTLEKQEAQFRQNLANVKEAYANGLEGVTQVDIDFWYDMVSRASSETQRYKLGITNGLSGTASMVASDIKSSTGEVKEASEGVKDAVTEPLSTLPEELQGIDAGMLDQAGIDMGQLTDIYNTGGMDAVNELLGSFKDGEDDAKEAGKEVANSAHSGTSTLSNLMSEDGNNGVDSLYSSLTSKESKSKAYQGGATLANEANKGYKETSEIHSPSRVFRRFGEFTVQGLVNGMTSFKDKVANASSDIAQTSIDTMSSLLSNVSNILNSDLEDDLTITPMIDLSNITAGADEINRMLNGNRMIGLSSAANSASSAAWARRNQNGISVNNGNVVDAIQQLRGDITDLNSKVGNLQVVMDTGALVGQISTPIDTSLGRQSLYKQRGI